MPHPYRCVIALAAVTVLAPAAAVATPLAPLVYTEAAQNSSYRQGAFVREVGDGWGGVTQTALHHTDFFGTPGFYTEQLGGASPPFALISAHASEPTAGDHHTHFGPAGPATTLAYVAFQGPGGSELYAEAPGTAFPAVNLSGGSAGREDHPAVHSGWITWQTGSASTGWNIMLNQFNPSTGGTTIAIGSGERPAIWMNLVVWEDAGDIAVYDRATASSSSISSPYDLYFPAVGGSRIFYERYDPATNQTEIAYRAASDLTTEYLIAGPCATHHRPRVSGNGQYLLYTGTGCPGVDGAQPLYLTYVQPNGAQTTYLIADLRFTNLSRLLLTPYDIDEEVVTYHISSGIGIYDLLASRIDTSSL